MKIRYYSFELVSIKESIMTNKFYPQIFIYGTYYEYLLHTETLSLYLGFYCFVIKNNFKYFMTNYEYEIRYYISNYL